MAATARHDPWSGSVRLECPAGSAGEYPDPLAVKMLACSRGRDRSRFSQQRFPWQADELFASLIELGEAEFLGIFQEDHVGMCSTIDSPGAGAFVSGRLPCLSFGHVFAHNDDVELPVRFRTARRLPHPDGCRPLRISETPREGHVPVVEDSRKMLLDGGTIVGVHDERNRLADQCVCPISQFRRRPSVAFTVRSDLGVDGQQHFGLLSNSARYRSWLKRKASSVCFAPEMSRITA